MTLAQDVRKLAINELCNSGMEFKNGVFIIKLEIDVLGWLGLNEATRYMYEINPVVGVRNEAVERLIAELRNRELSNKQIHPTVSTHLGYVMPIFKTYRPWHFYDGKDFAKKVKKMVNAINKYGRSFMEANISLESLVKAMEKHEVRYHKAYRLPAVYYLMGKPKLAKDYILNELTKLGDTHPWDIEYKEYAKKFLERL
jgi:hypothetical protein